MATGCCSVFSDRKVRNWINVGLAVKFVRDGLKDIAVDEITEFSGQIYDEIREKHTILSTTTCNNCSNKSILGNKKVKCKIHLCDNVRDKIISAHRRSYPIWKNTDVSKWESSNWEIAKCFMPDGYKFRNTVEETDFNGIINILINLKRFDNKMAADLSRRCNVLTEAKNVANEFRHNAHCKFDDTEFNDCIKKLSNVLKDPKYIAATEKAQNALEKVEQLCSEEWKIDITGMKAALRDVTVDSHQEMNKEKRRILDEIQQYIHSEHSALKKQIQRGIKRIRKESDTQEKRLKQATVDDYTARKNGLRQNLIDYFKKDCRTISISPFLEEEEISLQSFYVTPIMQLREHHLAKDESPVESYGDIFTKGGIRYKHIYITGEAGVGKTTLIMIMSKDGFTLGPVEVFRTSKLSCHR